MKKDPQILIILMLLFALPYQIFSQTENFSIFTSIDTDGDGITDDIDIDDDNDGILDTIECPSCFYTQQESEQVINVTTDFILENASANPLSDAFDGINGVDDITNFTGLIHGQTYTETKTTVYEITPRNPIKLESVRFYMYDIAFTKDRVDEDGDGDIDPDTLNKMQLQGWTGTAWENLDNLENRYLKNQSQTFTNKHHHNTVYSKFRITGIGEIEGARVREVFLLSRNYQASDYPKTTTGAKDTDGDNTPGYLDLDSDGDGCSDSVEAGNTLVSENNITSYNTGLDTNNNGLLDIFEDGTTGNINYKANYTNAVLNATINGCVDTDGDGISDLIDIDDDNDGVLDINEGGEYIGYDISTLTWRTEPDLTISSDNSTSFTPSNTNRYINDNVNISSGGITYNWQAAITTQTFNLPVDLSFTYSVISGTIIFGFSPEETLLPGKHNSSNTFGFQIAGRVTSAMHNLGSTGVSISETNSNGKIHRIKIDEAGNLTLYVNNTIIYTQTGLSTTEDYKLYISTNNKDELKSLENIQFTHYSSDLSFSTDTDNDNITNNLDLDSDEDGCSDSIEAGNTSHNNNNTTTFNTGDDLNKNGLLDIFEDGTTGTINYSSTYSNFAMNTDINACTDTDNDNITDVYDIDDDNDGILDTKELENCLIAGVKNDFSEYNDQWLDDSGKISKPQQITGNSSSLKIQTNSFNIGQTLPIALSLPLTIKWYETEKHEFWMNLFPYSQIGAFDPRYDNPDAITLRSNENSSRLLPLGLINIGSPYRGVNNSRWKIEIFDAGDGTATVQLWEIDNTGSEISMILEKTGFPTEDWALSLGSQSTIELEIESPTFNSYDFCDQDNDSISNHLDLDSDGDGCADAMEAAIDRLELQDAMQPNGTETFAYGQVAGPYSENGLADSIESDDTKTATVNNSIYTIGNGLSSYNDEALDSTISTACYIPTSIDFDGVDDFAASKSFLSGYQDVTLMTWVKRDPSISTKGYIAGEELFNITIDASGIAQANLITNSSSTNYQTLSTSTIEKGIWHHITAVYSGSNETLKLYVNGELESTNTSVPSSTLSTENIYTKQHFSIGANDTDNINYFFGAIDEVRVFNIALTDDQIQQMVYQEIEKNGDNVIGKVISKNIEDSTSNALIPWNNLQAYFDMTTVADGKTVGLSNNLRDLVLYNITSTQEQSAPMPYQSNANGDWSSNATWLYGDAWNISDQDNNKDWIIVNIKNKVTSSKNQYSLGFIVDTDAEFILADNHALVNSWYLELNGTINLLDDSQLLQTTKSDLITSSTGKILRRQEGHSSAYRYNYWASPVGTPIATGLIDDSANINNPNNSSFKLSNLKDNNDNTFLFTGAYNQTGKISTRWTYTYLNGITYYDWIGINQNTAIPPGVGYTQKGTGNAGDTQQYIFEGRPNNGTIFVAASDVPNDSDNESENAVTLTTTLVGNPYPSSLDVTQFITDNEGVINGTLYIWDQWAGNTHILNDYQGGYATVNKTASVVAYQFVGIDGENNNSILGVKTPTGYIAVGQGFMTEILNDGDIVFNNNQRVFKTEYNNESIFFRTATESNTPEDLEEEDVMKLIKLRLTLPSNAQREIAIGFNNTTTNNFDYGYDGKLFEVQKDDIYTNLNGDSMSIQAFEMFQNDTEIPLTYIAYQDQNLSINASVIENFENYQNIYLKDNYLDVSFSLINFDTYNFYSEAGTFTDRFTLVFHEDNTLNTETDVFENTLIYVNKNEKKLYIKNFNTTAQSIQLFSVLGQVMLSKTNVDAQILNNTGIDVSKLSSGTYIVQLQDKNNHKLTKKLIIN